MDDDTITLHDSDSGATARLLPRRGLNCFSFQVPVRGQIVDVLWTAPDFVTGQARPASSGIPILFPFPGRLHGTSFEFDGRRFELQPGDAYGNAIHGFVLDRPWRIIEHSRSQAIGRFTASVDAPELLEHWPADFQLTATYQLAGRRLSLRIDVENVGGGPLPFGLGLHPYFRVPVGEGNAAACEVTVPVERCWQLKDMLPTGELIPAGQAGLANHKTLFANAQFDHVFTDVIVRDGVATAEIRDPQSSLATVLAFDATYRECVVYTPGHREAICIEPYTCVPDAYRLAASGHDTGLRILEPGEAFSASIEIRVDAI